MKKHFYFLLLAVGLFPVSFLKAQNVGIGEPNPGSKLSIKGGLSVGTDYSSLTAPTGGLIIQGVMGLGTTSPDSNAVLDIASTSKGIKFPGLTASQRSSIHNPSKGLVVFDKDSNNIFFNDGSNWQSLVNLSQVTSLVTNLTSGLLGGLGGGGGSTWYTGTSAPSALTGSVNDMYINTSTSDYYKKTTAITWTLEGNLAGEGYGSTSTTSSTIGTGSKTFTTQSKQAYQPNDRLRIANSSSKYMEGTVTSYSGTSLVMSITRTVGSGTYSSWNIGIVGDVGATGATGADGNNGAVGATGADGVAGPTGADGARGQRGVRGLTGADGPQGAQGVTGPTGANGAQGVTGAAGAAGSQGAQGIAGPTGANGVTGATGPQGLQGATGGESTWLSGNGNVGNGQGNVGDWYLRLNTGDIFHKTGNLTWTNVMNIMGSAGATGPAGAQGPAGSLSNGSSVGNTPYWNGSSWVLNSSNIYNNGGNVGIGTTSPSHDLDVSGTGRFTGKLTIGSYTLPSTDGSANQVLSTNGSGVVSWATASAGSGWSLTGNAGNAGTGFIGTTNNTSFRVKTNNHERLTVDSTGNVGIGTTAPSKTLDVVSNTTGVNVMNVQSTSNTGWSSIDYYNASGVMSFTTGFANPGTGSFFGGNAYLNSYGNDLIVTNNGSSYNIYMNGSNGNIGIGTSSPSYPLDVAGTAHFTGKITIGSYTLPNTDGSANQVLTTNGSGTVSWQDVSGGEDGGGSGWGLTGSSATSSNFVGTTNNQALQFKVHNTIAGYLGASDNNTFFGNSLTYTNGSDNVGLGYRVTIYGNITNSIAIGSSAQIQPGSGSSDDIAIGNSANITGGSAYHYSTAIGTSAQAQSSNSIVIGKSANANQQYSIALGDAAQSQGTSAIVIGQNAYSNSSNAISIGSSANSQGDNAIVIGQNSYANADNSIAIGSGSSNTQAQGKYAISLGYQAYTSQQNAIAIGYGAQAQGSNSIALGTSLYNGNNNTVAIGNSSVTSLNFSGASSTSHALTVGANSSNGNGAYLTKGGVWTNASDKNLKEDFTKISNDEILSKISQLSVTRWKYKGTDEYHIGPVAQDFYALFHVGVDNKRISTIDPSGIALAAIKALNDKISEQQKTIDNLLQIVKKLKVN